MPYTVFHGVLGFNIRWLIRAMMRLGCKPLLALLRLYRYIGD